VPKRSVRTTSKIAFLKLAPDGRSASLARFPCWRLSPYPPGDCAHR
jgi:hypothetical protein